MALRTGLVAFLLALTACGNAVAPISYTGTFTLQSVDAHPLPATLYDDAQRGHLEIVADSIRILGDGTFSKVAVLRHGLADTTWTTTAAVHGTYVRTGSSILFTNTDSTYFTGAFSARGKVLDIVWVQIFHSVYTR